MNDEELRKVIGESAFRWYEQATDMGKERVRGVASDLPELSDVEFIPLCRRAILASAQAIRFRGNWADEHAIADAFSEESERRHVAAGHADDCRGHDLYSEAFHLAYVSQGRTRPGKVACTCGFEEGK